MAKFNDLQNQIFGRWTVTETYTERQTPSGRLERKWLCRCQCGTERYVLERSLLYGGSKSCGCATAENSARAITHELTGRVFGELTALYKSPKQGRDSRGGIWWHCRCRCGGEIDVLASLLVNGRKSHCGCKSNPNYYFENIEGRVFGKLTALYPLSARDKKGGVVWHCRCECGAEADIPYGWLMYSGVRSCGCQKKEHDKLLPGFLTRVDGTSIDMIRSKKLPVDNTSGVKGVYYHHGKWMAKIVFQKKQYHLGQFRDKADAIRARRVAEEELFDKVTDYYGRWKVLADRYPDWAQKNPMKVIVEKSNGEFRVVILPLLDALERNNA